MTYKIWFAVFVALGYANLSYAAVSVYEPFNYGPVGADVVGSGGGGSFGFTDNWHGDPSITIASGNLPSPVPTLATLGNHVSADAVDQNRYIVRTLAQPIGADNTTVFLSFIMQAEDVVGAGAYAGWFAVALETGTREVTIGKDSFHSQYKIEGATNSDVVLTSVPVVANQPHLFVVRANFLLGNDIYRLYIDPPSGPEPVTASATMTSFDLGTATSVGLFGPGAYGVDELRIGTSWSDVAVPEPSTAVLAANFCALLATRRRRRS